MTLRIPTKQGKHSNSMCVLVCACVCWWGVSLQLLVCSISPLLLLYSSSPRTVSSICVRESHFGLLVSLKLKCMHVQSYGKVIYVVFCLVFDDVSGHHSTDRTRPPVLHISSCRKMLSLSCHTMMPSYHPF